MTVVLERNLVEAKVGFDRSSSSICALIATEVFRAAAAGTR